MKLLIVEDSNLVSTRLQLAFGKVAALETEIADCLELALALFRTLQPELVILDIELPDGNGLDLLQTIKCERPATQVLMFSNHEFFRQRCTALGADYFFDKSGEFEALALMVQSLVSDLEISHHPDGHEAGARIQFKVGAPLPAGPETGSQRQDPPSP